jgi:hypothetical protein
VLSHSLTFDIVPAEAAPAETEPAAAPSWLDRVWQAIRGFFGVGG